MNLYLAADLETRKTPQLEPTAIVEREAMRLISLGDEESAVLLAVEVVGRNPVNRELIRSGRGDIATFAGEHVPATAGACLVDRRGAQRRPSARYVGAGSRFRRCGGLRARGSGNQYRKEHPQLWGGRSGYDIEDTSDHYLLPWESDIFRLISYRPKLRPDVDRPSQRTARGRVVFQFKEGKPEFILTQPPDRVHADCGLWTSSSRVL